MRRLTAEQRDLAERFLPLARRVSRGYKSAFPRFTDEIESAANLGLIRAVRDHRPELGPLPTFVIWSVKHRIGDFFRDSKPKGFRDWKLTGSAPRILASSDVCTFAGHELEYDGMDQGTAFLAAIVDDHAEPPNRPLDDRDEAEAMLRKLPRGAADVLRLTFLEGVSQAEAGRRLGFSQAEASRKIHLARKLMGVA